MATDVSIESLFPVIKHTQNISALLDVHSTTFVGIDFGTSTTVVSIASIDKNSKKICTDAVWLNQRLHDGTIVSSEKIPTALAWYNEQLLVGQGAAELKHSLKKGINVWFSFKMELGVDLGAKYYNSELGRDSDFPILNPKDAARVFFQYLKAQINRYVTNNNLPSNIQYAVSIPASFEANQRKELIQALEQNGIAINKQALIDEPNAAFLSYVQNSNDEIEPIRLPEGDNPKVLVFDFGAGTCDVSILELGKNLNGIYSKNLSISKFEKLGGDDIDHSIALEYLFPQLLEESGKQAGDFRTPERNRIVSQLLRAAEQLKIMICNAVALQMTNKVLPSNAISSENVSLGIKIEIDTRHGLLTLSEPKLSFQQFNEVMKTFLRSNKFSSLTQSLSESISKILKTSINEQKKLSIFKPIESALEKANAKKDEIDYVIFIGGSSKNPYVQAALKEYFSDSELLLPRDLQTHVSAGAAIHSLIYNGFNKNIIQPITSEPFIVITKDDIPKIILRAGTQVPCDVIVIDDLVTTRDGQQAIELPICLGNSNKMLYNIKIVSGEQGGFKKNTPVRLEIEITADKTLHVRASAAGQQVFVEPIYPFANSELTSEERMVLKAERQANIEAEANSGKPTKESLQALFKAHAKVGNHLRAAETLEALHDLYPNIHNYNQIGVLYSSAGHEERALHYYELGYLNNKSATTAFNYAHELIDRDNVKSKAIFEESLRLDPDKPHTLFELGNLLDKEGNPQGNEMKRKAFNIWKAKYDTNQMGESDYSWLSFVADNLGMKDFAQQVRESKPRINPDTLYDKENLTQIKQQEQIGKRIKTIS
jgi:molecular chaperone DnaK